MKLLINKDLDEDLSEIHIVIHEHDDEGEHHVEFIEVEDQHGASISVCNREEIGDYTHLILPLEKPRGLDALHTAAKEKLEHVELSVSTMRTGKVRVALYGQSIDEGVQCEWEHEADAPNVAADNVFNQMEAWFGP